MQGAVPTAGGAPEAAEVAPGSRELALFGLLWAAATLFNQGNWGRIGSPTRNLILSGAALVALLFPGRVAVLVGFAAVQVACIFLQLPEVVDHWLFTMIVALTLVVSFAALRRRGPVSPGALYRTFAPLARLEVIALWSWAALHKLNSAYFDPAVSSVPGLYRRAAEILPLLPAGPLAQRLAIYASFGVEASLPLLLLLPRTRRAGVLLGIGFHFLLGLVLYYDFSTMLYALYWLFLPAPAWSETAWRRIRIGVALPLVAATLAACSFTPPPPWARGSSFSHALFLALFLVYAAGLVMVVSLERGQLERAFAVERRWLLILPLLVVTIGAARYCGLRGRNSWDMFSGLQLRDGRSNHFFLPSLPLGSRWVRVERSNDPRLQPGWQGPEWALRTSLARRAGNGRAAIVTYSDGGRSITVASPDEHSLRWRLLSKLLDFPDEP